MKSNAYDNIPSLEGRRIAFIGGAGFIGHNMALTLRALGAEVAVVDSLQVNNLYKFAGGSLLGNGQALYLDMLHRRLELLRTAGVPLYVHDARDYHGLSRLLSNIKPQTIVQLAAVSHANLSNKDPYSTFDHSFRTLENALDWARDQAEHFIYFSSSMVYGHFSNGFVTEDTPCEPIGIYAALKFGGEKLVIAYNQAFDLPYTIIRPSALYGERCVSRRVGQIFIEKALKGEEITINGDGSDRLDFTYIDDFVQGAVRVIANPASRNNTYNLTYGESRSLAQMAAIIDEHFPGCRISYQPKDNLTPDRGTLCVDKARNDIGYTPQWPLEKGFVKYINWYKQLMKKEGGADCRYRSQGNGMKNQLTRDWFLSEQLGKDAYAAEASLEALAVIDDLSPLPAFIFCKCPAGGMDLINAFESRGFRYVETAMRYEGDTSALLFPERPQGLTLRAAVPDDAEAVRSLARDCLTRSRFHNDPEISRAQAEQIKADWAGNYFSGKRGDGMILAEFDGEIAGFLLLLISGASVVVDLVAVGRAHRNRGVGKALLQAAVEKFPHCETLSAGTQSVNGPAVRFYESVGMRFLEAVVVLHCHRKVSGS